MLKNKIELIESRIRENLKPTYLNVLDDSNQHKGHQEHRGGGRHFSIIVSAPCLSTCTRIEAHRKIYELFTDLIPDEIHALKIKIVVSQASY